MISVLRRSTSTVSGCLIRSRTRSTRFSLSASFIALGLFYATTGMSCGAELPAAIARAGVQRPTLPTCSYDISGKTLLQGTLRVARKSAQLPSVVQFFPSSDETEYYLDGLESQLSGRLPGTSTQQGSDTQRITDAVRHMQQLPLLLSSAKLSVAGANGVFSCSGFLPGNYVLLGTLAGDRDQRGNRVHSYWRADVAVPSPNRQRVYEISGFHYLGQAATP